MSDVPEQLEPEELQKWLNQIAQANHHNIFCHCRDCHQEWIASDLDSHCPCGSYNVERIPCWQFPDD